MPEPGGTDWGGGWDPDPEDYRRTAVSRTPTDYESEAYASGLERFVPPPPSPVEQGVGSLLGDAGQQAKSWWERTWGPNPNLKNPLLTGIAAPFEMLLNAGAAALGIPLDAQLFTNQILSASHQISLRHIGNPSRKYMVSRPGKFCKIYIPKNQITSLISSYILRLLLILWYGLDSKRNIFKKFL